QRWLCCWPPYSAAATGHSCRSRRYRRFDQGTWSISPQGRHQPFELAVEEGEAGLEVDGIFRVSGLFGLNFHGIAIDRRLMRCAIAQTRRLVDQALRGNMVGVGALQLHGPFGAALLRFEHAGEVQV